MRIVLALLAVLALLVSPVTAAAAQVACDENSPSATSTMDISAMPEMGHASDPHAAADPCCDHGGPHKMDLKTCALACATSCAVTAVLPDPIIVSELAFSAALLTPARSATARPYEPSRLMRPPRSMA